MTPYQYLLRTRLHRAAVRAAGISDEPISAIAFEAGFNDLSTFNRRFRRVMGATPRRYRIDKAAAGSPDSCVPSDDDFTTAFVRYGFCRDIASRSI